MTELTEALKHNGLAGVHPAADLFRMMDDDEIAAVTDDMTQHGIRESVYILPDGLLLDGRNRLLIAYRLGLEVKKEIIETDDPYAWVISTNLMRRQLTPGQKALAVLRSRSLVKRFEDQAAERTKANQERFKTANGGAPSSPPSPAHAPETGEVRVNLARIAGVASTTISAVKAVMPYPDLVEAIQNDDLPLRQVAKVARRRHKQETASTTEVADPTRKKKSKFNLTTDLVGWASWTWNPVTGCDHGCVYCYAREIAESLQGRGVGYDNGFAPTFHPDRLDAPANSKVPDSALVDPRDGRVFVCSMADLFGKWVPKEWIDQVFASCEASPQWEYLFLTKFPSRYKSLTLPKGTWAGASVDTQRRVVPTMEAMAATTASVRWLSLEPLLEPLRFPSLAMFDVIVIGAQTPVTTSMGHVPAFAPELDWVIDLMEQARMDGCNVYLKDNLFGVPDSNHPGMTFPQEGPARRH